MATTTKIERIVVDHEPNGMTAVRVAWIDDAFPYLLIEQDEDTIHLRPEHAAEVASAITAALAERP